MPHPLLIFLVLSIAGTSAGCTTALKQVYYEVRGAKSEVLTIHESPRPVLERYQRVTINQATTDLGQELCPPDVLIAWQTLRGPSHDELRKHYPGQTPTIAVDAEVIYFQKKGILSEAQLLSRVRMRDAESNRVLVDGLVRTESSSFRKGDEEDLVESHLGAIQEYLIEIKAPPEDEDNED